MPNFTEVAMLFAALAVPAQQASPSSKESVTVLESHLGLTCDPSENRCIITQTLIVTAGARKLELRVYENKPTALLGLGTYPGQRVPGKTNTSYRIDESYILTYPDGKSEKYDVVGILP